MSIQENEPPEAGLQETQRASWRAALVLIDPRHHEDGQKVALEHDPKVGQPPALFASLAAHINHRDPPSYFVIEVNAISDASDFWIFVQENRGSVTSVIFELVAPNMFGIEDDYDAEMRDILISAERLVGQVVRVRGASARAPWGRALLGAGADSQRLHIPLAIALALTGG